MTKTITTEINGATYKIELTGEDIRISGGPRGHYIGDGIYRDGAIHDCDARLGETPEETEEMYQALEQALRDAVGAEEPAVTFSVCDGHKAGGSVQPAPGQGWEALPEIATMDKAEQLVRERLDAGTVRESYEGHALVIIRAEDEDGDVAEERLVEVRA